MNQILDPEIEYFKRLQDHSSFEYKEWQREQDIKYKKKQKVKAEIKKLVKFVESKHPVKFCISKQDSSRMVFFDVFIDENCLKTLLSSNNIKDPDTLNNIRKWDVCIGRTHGITNHAMYEIHYEFWKYIQFDVIPAIEEAYHDYCLNNLYGKPYTYDDPTDGRLYCKKDTIDMFNEWFKGDKIESTYTKCLNKLKKQYEDHPRYPEIEPTDEEKAFIDSVEMGHVGLIRHCEDVISNPEIYAGLKDWKSYIHTAEKILHTKFI